MELIIAICDKVFQNWDKILTILFWFCSVLFAWLSWYYSKLAYLRNQFSWKVSMNTAIWDFGINWIQELIVFSFANDGHRKWLIRNVYLELNNKKMLFFLTISRDFFVPWFGLPNFPYELDEMWELSFSMYKNDFIKCINESTKQGKIWKLKCLCFVDNVWNVYRYKLICKHWKELF